MADFGNLALYAEILASTLGTPQIQAAAEELFQFAYDLNPQHTNNRLNFVSFILDSKAPVYGINKLQFAKDLLGELIEPYKDDDLIRWYQYRAQLAQRVNEDATPYILPVIDIMREKPSEDIFARLTAVYNRDTHVDREYLRIGARLYVPQVNGQAKQIALLLYADALGRAPQYQAERLEVYKYVTRPVEEGGITDDPALPYRGNACFNYGVDLLHSEYIRETGRQWYESYQSIGQSNQSGNLNNNYAAYLITNCHRPDLAKIVSDRGPLNECALPDDDRELPLEFVPGGMQGLELLS